MVIHGIDVEIRGVKVGRGGGDEFGACASEQVFEEWQSLGSTSLQSDELIAVLFPQCCVDRIVQLRGIESHAYGDKGVHLVVLLGNGIVLRVLLKVLGPRDVDEDMREHANGIGIPAHHHVAEAHVIISREMRRHHPCEHGFLIQLDIIQRLQCQRVVPQ